MDDSSAVAVGALVFVAVSFGLFKCGQWMRFGVELRKHIEGKRVWAIATKTPYDRAKYRQLDRKARLFTVGSLLALCVLYTVVAIEWGLTTLFISLLSLVIVGFGYSRYGLCRCFRRHQHLVGGGLKTGSNGPLVTTSGQCRSQRDKPLADIK